MDAFRSFLFISLAAGLLFLYFKKIVKKEILMPGLIMLVLVDLWTVDKRYLNNDQFVNKRVEEAQFATYTGRPADPEGYLLLPGPEPHRRSLQ